VDAGQLATRDRQVAGVGGAAGQDHGVELGAQLVDGDVGAHVHAGAELGALGLASGRAAVEVALLHLELGDAVAQQAADAVGPLEDDHGVAGPGELLGRGQAGGTGADHGDLLAGAPSGSDGHHPALGPGRSMIETSTCLMVTGSWLMPSTHADSHGAGQSRPVNSGKLLVACRRSMASCQRSRYTRSFQSGMRLPSGQPLLQNGMPQSMQRLAWVWSRLGGELLVDLLPVLEAHRHRAPDGQLPAVLQKSLVIAHVSSSALASMMASSMSAPASLGGA
jgi:hypothetical protein